MTEQDNSQPKPRKRRWLYIRIVGWLLAIGWFAWFAYVRITTPPAGASGEGSVVDYDVAVLISKLSQASAALPPPPNLTPSQGPSPRLISGIDQSVLFGSLFGEWSPQPGSDHEQALTYFTTRSNQVALDQIASALDQPIDLAILERSASNPAATNWWSTGAACIALASRARHKSEAQSDYDGALADLRAATRLDALVRTLNARNQMFWYGRDYFAVLFHEIGCQARERPWTPAAARQLVDLLSNELTLRISDTLMNDLRIDENLDDVLSRYYTDDGTGDGWLVLSSTGDLTNSMFASSNSPRSRVWNIFSPLFYGRAKVRRIFAELPEQYRALDNMTWPEAEEYIRVHTDNVSEDRSVLMGPLAAWASRIDGDRFQNEFARVACTRALVVMLALSAYKYDHGQYPDSLDLLAPAYVDTVPLEACSNAPFAYKLRPDGTYQLGPAGHAPWDVQWISLQLHSLPYKDNPYMPRRDETIINEPDVHDESDD